ncbi:hypothetical protein H2203_006085 [Taxawa tesnikishii (nom. ined.)]|nr:hypothetical protein H2203_006085 [Dothideales sp. JES 119]
MPSILSDDDKTTVKRVVPKASNKIHAVAVAKLYVAYPNRHRWTYTGLQGAAVLANDLVGNTFWIKLVDVSPSNRGVLWDQEIYDTFQYNQDRTFFHSFELEDCMAGLSFVDEKEAKQFKKKMDEREKNAHKNTRNKPFGNAAQPGYHGTAGAAGHHGGGGGKSHSRFGLGGLLGHRHSSASQQPPAQSIIPPREVQINTPPQPSPARSRASSTIDLTDPAVQGVLNDLLAMGITEDQIEEHSAFIRTYLEQNKATQAAATAESDRKLRAPPPPPPSAAPARLASISPQTTGGSTTASKRGPAPAPRLHDELEQLQQFKDHLLHHRPLHVRLLRRSHVSEHLLLLQMRASLLTAMRLLLPAEQELHLNPLRRRVHRHHLGRLRHLLMTKAPAIGLAFLQRSQATVCHPALSRLRRQYEVQFHLLRQQETPWHLRQAYLRRRLHSRPKRQAVRLRHRLYHQAQIAPFHHRPL